MDPALNIHWYDVRVKEGDTWTKKVRVRQGNGTPYPLDDVILRMQIRDDIGAAVARFDLTIDDGISVDTETGVITITVARADTGGILRGAKVRALYSDLEALRDGPPEWSMILVNIRWIVEPKVTRS